MFSPRLFLLAMFTLAAWPAAAVFADVTIQGSLTPKRVAILTVKESKDVLWDVYPEPEEYQEIGGAVVFAGPPGQVYTVKALVINFDAKTKERSRVVVTFAGKPVDPVNPVDPVKPIDPKPPVPVDAFTSKIVAAFAKETAANKAQLAASMAQVYRLKATEATTTNAARFIDFMLLLEAARSAADGGALTEIRTAISAELNTILPTTVTTALDAAGKTLLSNQMARVAAALEACK
jgi:hypothetical protein